MQYNQRSRTCLPDVSYPWVYHEIQGQLWVLILIPCGEHCDLTYLLIWPFKMWHLLFRRTIVISLQVILMKDINRSFKYIQEYQTDYEDWANLTILCQLKQLIKRKWIWLVSNYSQGRNAPLEPAMWKEGELRPLSWAQPCATATSLVDCLEL
jgi:hypothetical protein